MVRYVVADAVDYELSLLAFLDVGRRFPYLASVSFEQDWFLCNALVFITGFVESANYSNRF